MNQDIAELKAVLDKLPPKDKAFAASLVKNGERYGVSEKQLYWVTTLTKRATGEVLDIPVLGDVGSFEGVYTLFGRALKVNKYPKLRLQAADQVPVVLAVAGSKSAHPGVVNVTDGGSFGNSKWYGRVAPDGTWTPGQDFPELAAVAKLLQELSARPEATVSAYGKLTGRCSFCGRPLEDAHSTAVGYGPVCAGKWGLSDKWKNAKALIEA